MLLCQYSIIGYFTALFCVLMSSIDVIMLGEWRLGPITCNIWYTVDTVLNTTSAWLSTSLMLERLVSTEAPQFYLNLSKKCKTLVAFFPWVLSILLTSLGISLQEGGFHNFVSNNATSIEQCYIVDQNNETAIYSAVVSFLLPYAITLSLFITIKSKAAFKQTRLTLSKSLESISDVLLDSDPEEGTNNPSYFSERNYTPPDGDTLGKMDILATDTNQSNRQSEDVYDKASPNGHNLFQTRKVYGKQEATNPGYPLCRKHYHNNRSTCSCSTSLPNKKTEHSQRTDASNIPTASQHQLVRTKTVLNDIDMFRKGHLNANRKLRPINTFANPYRRTLANPHGKSSSSAYLAALHKAKHKRRAHKAYEQMSSNVGSTSSNARNASCAKHTSTERIEQVYVNRKCIPSPLDQSEPPLQHSLNKFCSLHGKQCQSVMRYVENGDASSSDSESSHGLIQKDDKTEARPKREHIIMTNILQSEQLKTVHHLTIVVSLYALLWMPFYILRLLFRFAPQITIYHYVYTTVHLLGYFSSGICPWFYYVLHGYINSSTWPNMKYRILNPSNSDLSSASSI